MDNSLPLSSKVNDIPFLNTSPTQEFPKESTHHIIFVVHGIGSCKESLENKEKRFRKILDKVLIEKKEMFSDSVELKMLDWKSYLIEEAGNQIDQITLKNHKKKRHLLNTFPADILFYLSHKHNHNILLQIVRQANEHYEKIVSTRKEGNIAVHFLAHSLGGVITYDLLNKNYQLSLNDNTISKKLKLNFEVQQVFLLGSPISLFLTINEEKKIVPLDQKEFIKGLYNIFHPHDLIAYRLEFLIEGYECDLEPMFVKCYKKNGFKNHKKIKKNSLWDFCFCRGEERKWKEGERKRYDYELQESWLEHWVEVLGVLRGHDCYWENEDVAYFMIRKMGEEKIGRVLD